MQFYYKNKLFCFSCLFICAMMHFYHCRKSVLVQNECHCLHMCIRTTQMFYIVVLNAYSFDHQFRELFSHFSEADKRSEVVLRRHFWNKETCCQGLIILLIILIIEEEEEELSTMLIILKRSLFYYHCFLSLI